MTLSEQNLSDSSEEALLPCQEEVFPDAGEGRDVGSLRSISLVEEMKRSYLDYAMSVIVARALPDVRDGLKPVHRRILYAMFENGYEWNKPYRKSARVVGDVMGRYHPHGDAAIYDALVRMAQDFSLRLPLVEGQGNFGSVDGDPPAAMRYTECRLQKVTGRLLDDLDKRTVDFQDNYDASEHEPIVLPAKFPNLLINGAGGIAVGMATNIPPHNPGEIIDAVIALIENPALSLSELMEIVPGPDFPTGGILLGRAGIASAFETGRGGLVLRGRVHQETLRKDKEALIITEIPYQLNKTSLIEKIAELLREKRIEGISDLRDESDRSGMRIVIELKRDAQAEIVLNQLYRFSPLQTGFGVNMVALHGGRPQLMGLREMLQAFITFREEVVTRRTRFLLAKTRDRMHVLVGLAITVANIDAIVSLIRKAPSPRAAHEALRAERWQAQDVAALIALVDDPRHVVRPDGTYQLSEAQATAILELRLQRLTALGQEEIAEELRKLAVEIREYLDILCSPHRILSLVREEVLEVKAVFGTPRRTEIQEDSSDFDQESLIPKEEMVVTVSHAGYIKRVPLEAYRAQRRGGKGRSAMTTRSEDFVTQLFVTSTHTSVLFFSSRGIVYKLKVYRLPKAAPQATGKALVNLLPLEKEERITTILPLPEEAEREGELWNLLFATAKGSVRRNKLSDFLQVSRAGKIAMKLEEGESIIGVSLCRLRDSEGQSCSQDVLLTTAFGQTLRFCVEDLRVNVGRNSMGVRGISLAPGDRVIGMTPLNHFDCTIEERDAYLRLKRHLEGSSEEEALEEEEEGEGETEEAREESGSECTLTEERIQEMRAAEQMILFISTSGYGKRTSSFEFRVFRRGGKGIRAARLASDGTDALAAAFPVEEEDQVLLVTDDGQLIRCPVAGISCSSRMARGVIVFKAEGHVVSVEPIRGSVLSMQNLSQKGEEEELESENLEDLAVEVEA